LLRELLIESNRRSSPCGPPILVKLKLPEDYCLTSSLGTEDLPVAGNSKNLTMSKKKKEKKKEFDLRRK